MVATLRWREVSPVPEPNGALGSVLDSADALRNAWEDWLRQVSDDDFVAARHRSLRRHAIETGIIERLYDVDWGVTEALVAEGLTLDAASREGGIDTDTLAVINTQFDALRFLAEAVREGRDLTVGFVRELHQAITRRQDTYTCRDSLGRTTERRLRHGEWKTQANHVYRPDGTLLEYVPPEHVASQMDRLVELYAQSADAHPIVRASWLHHHFGQIHPFEDGNGRVARALTLLVLLRARYAPLVVDRRERTSYLEALAAANEDDLRPLIRLFARLEIVALRSELERSPAHVAADSGAVGVARAYVERLRTLSEHVDEHKAQEAERLADTLHAKVQEYLSRQRDALKATFGEIDDQARATVFGAAPPEERARYWRAQLIYAANAVDFYANLNAGSWWNRLHVEVFGYTLRFIAAVQKVGQGTTGVLALTVYAEILPPRDTDKDTDEERPRPERALDLTPSDSVTFVYSDDARERWPEVEDLLARTLPAALERFGRRLEQSG